MKLSNIVLTTLVSTIVLSACGDDHKEQDAQHKRELECIDSTGDRLCRGEGELAILKSKTDNEQFQQPQIQQTQQVQYQQEREVVYPPVQPGEYHNYYGNPQYGTWGSDGRYHFNDPYGPQASNTNAYLIGAGLGGLATYFMMKSAFDQKYHGHWSDQTYRSTQYYDGRGQRIKQNDYISRLEQSKRDNEAHKQRQRNVINAQRQQIDTHKADLALKQTQIDTHKADLIAKQNQIESHKADLAAQQAKNQQLQARLNASQMQKRPVQYTAPTPNKISIYSRNNTYSKKR
jgi:hypothetical protein